MAHTTKVLTVDRPTNGYYSTIYGYFAKDIKTKREVLIFWSAKSTFSEVWVAARHASEFLKAQTNGSPLYATKQGKGSSAYLSIDSTDWIIVRGETKRSLHGKTIEYILD